ncbi:putative UDP-glucuronate:xylan alpha-glucuronosyltransferase 4 [Citrus sinensis]|nr:putative UDP-glucuronate:xylan alpha-glucuronosyltransferase 4 [Citrus sinensis]
MAAASSSSSPSASNKPTNFSQKLFIISLLLLSFSLFLVVLSFKPKQHPIWLTSEIINIIPTTYYTDPNGSILSKNTSRVVDAEICSPFARPDLSTNVYVVSREEVTLFSLRLLLKPLGLESPILILLNLRSQKRIRDAGGFIGVNPPMPKSAQEFSLLSVFSLSSSPSVPPSFIAVVPRFRLLFMFPLFQVMVSPSWDFNHCIVGKRGIPCFSQRLRALRNCRDFVRSCARSLGDGYLIGTFLWSVLGFGWLMFVEGSLTVLCSYHLAEGHKIKVGLVNINDDDDDDYNGVRGDMHVETVHVRFDHVGEDKKWEDFFPEWIDEDHKWGPPTCPDIPMPTQDYRYLDVIVARVPCRGDGDAGGGMRDVFRGLQGLLGSCQIAPAFAQTGKEIWRYFMSQARLAKLNYTTYHQREAYVTVLHSSEAYVCGAIALAQSIIQKNSTRDLVLLHDKSISGKSLRGLRAAGWKTKWISCIRSPFAKKDSYNEWNYSKLRVWQLIEYDKIIFIDSDLLVLKNIDEFFFYPEFSAAGTNKVLFNSGVMVIEPSLCKFEDLTLKSFKVSSYNGGDQGFLNEVFTWWHRLPKRINHLKVFSKQDDKEHQVGDGLYAIHYLGLKPWMCYKDYDCNWDMVSRHKFASDSAHKKWWQVYDAMPKKLQQYCALTKYMDKRIKKWRRIAANASLANGHWKIKPKDPRQYHIVDDK